MAAVLRTSTKRSLAVTGGMLWRQRRAAAPDTRVVGAADERLVALMTARPDATLAELRDALPTTAALSTLWRRIDPRGFTLKTNGTRRRTAPA
jgi:hypothetical protein